MAHLVIANFLFGCGRQQGYRDGAMVGKSQWKANFKSHDNGILDFRFWIGDWQACPPLAPSWPIE
jgi:hypothetical protein